MLKMRFLYQKNNFGQQIIFVGFLITYLCQVIVHIDSLIQKPNFLITFSIDKITRIRIL